MLLKKKFKKIIIIAEIGVNHNGDLKIAKKLIKAAKKVALIMQNFKCMNLKKW